MTRVALQRVSEAIRPRRTPESDRGAWPIAGVQSKPLLAWDAGRPTTQAMHGVMTAVKHAIARFTRGDVPR